MRQGLGLLVALILSGLAAQSALAARAVFDFGPVRSNSGKGCLTAYPTSQPDRMGVAVIACADPGVPGQTWAKPATGGAIFTRRDGDAWCLTVASSEVVGTDGRGRNVYAAPCAELAGPGWSANDDGTITVGSSTVTLYLEARASPVLGVVGAAAVIAYPAVDGAAGQRWTMPPAPARNVLFDFIATGDPQYQNDPGAAVDRTATRTMTDVTMWGLVVPLARAYGMKGVIVAGDLTELSRNDEIPVFYDGIKGYEARIYEGLGNHDLEGVSYQGTESYAANTPALKTKVRRADREGMVHLAPTGMPFYSWDWDGVHFVQLNLVAADRPGFNSADDDVIPQINPENALDFLKKDLAAHHARYGPRAPIILVQHYCFLPAPKGYTICTHPRWWNDAQRAELYAVIRGEPVIAIITGHAHDSILSNYYYSWNGIPTFIVGAALAGRYVEIELEYDRVQNTGRLLVKPSAQFGAPTKDVHSAGR